MALSGVLRHGLQRLQRLRRSGPACDGLRRFGVIVDTAAAVLHGHRQSAEGRVLAPAGRQTVHIPAGVFRLGQLDCPQLRLGLVPLLHRNVQRLGDVPDAAVLRRLLLPGQRQMCHAVVVVHQVVLERNDPQRRQDHQDQQHSSDLFPQGRPAPIIIVSAYYRQSISPPFRRAASVLRAGWRPACPPGGRDGRPQIPWTEIHPSSAWPAQSR